MLSRRVKLKLSSLKRIIDNRGQSHSTCEDPGFKKTYPSFAFFWCVSHILLMICSKIQGRNEGKWGEQSYTKEEGPR
jgi:hypothetical protein